MLEYPEVTARAEELRAHVTGKRIKSVLPPTKPHKFCWFSGEAADYEKKLAGSTVAGAEGFGIFVELVFDNGQLPCINDGVNMRLVDSGDKIKDWQLFLAFEDGAALVFTVAMYGGIYLHTGEYDDPYYLKSRKALAPGDEGFAAYYRWLLEESKPNLSAKALLATEQRFPGIGNGVAQDILFQAGIHPKRKLGTLTEPDRVRLLESIRSVLAEMAASRFSTGERRGRKKRAGIRISGSIRQPQCAACLPEQLFLVPLSPFPGSRRLRLNRQPHPSLLPIPQTIPRF